MGPNGEVPAGCYANVGGEWVAINPEEEIWLSVSESDVPGGAFTSLRSPGVCEWMCTIKIPQRMSRKRIIKLMMAAGVCRNAASRYAEAANAADIPYVKAAEMFALQRVCAWLR